MQNYIAACNPESYNEYDNKGNEFICHVLWLLYLSTSPAGRPILLASVKSIILWLLSVEPAMLGLISIFRVVLSRTMALIVSVNDSFSLL